MKRVVIAAVIVACGVGAGLAAAMDVRMIPSGGRGDVVVGGAPTTSKATTDTTYLLGGPGAFDGRFENASGAPDWQGWTHADASVDMTPRWRISDYHVPTGGGAAAMWCGQVFPNGCGPGYGNEWNARLMFRRAVADPAQATVVTFRAVLSCDSEPGFDEVRIQANRGGAWQDILPATTGTHPNLSFDVDVNFNPADYVGDAGDEVQLRFLGTSDIAWSDEDCAWDTQGLVQVDNLQVTIDGVTYAEDFEDGDAGDWAEVVDTGAGDFAHLWTGLNELDICRSDYTAQVAFVDDGVVVPGTGGEPCTTWCYGPQGYIVNNTGGLVGDPYAVNNLVISPALTMPVGASAAYLEFQVYRHGALTPPFPGVVYQWHVRSVDTGDPADLVSAPWVDRGFVYTGDSLYLRQHESLSDLLVPGCTHLQVALRCRDLGLSADTDGTPAPYFDNVAVVAYAQAGPSVAAREADLAQDSFPERGVIDLANLANDWVRFDMARNIAAPGDLRNDPGDSIVASITPTRPGSVLIGLPRMIVKMKANPLFDGVRVLPTGFTQSGDVIDGFVYGDSIFLPNGQPVANRYSFDLPDSSFFFPGDVVHYYIEAHDVVDGNGGVTTLPAKLDGFEMFQGIMPYQAMFTVRALPTLLGPVGDQPDILFWNDAPGPGGDDEWLFALNNLGYRQGDDFDYYITHAPEAGAGNGLGGHATTATINGYDMLLYTCGDLDRDTLGNGDYAADPSNDIGLLDLWFQQGGKHAFLAGDNVVSSLTASGGAALTFVDTYLGVQLVVDDVFSRIGNQIAPRVRAIGGNSVFSSINEWWAAGGCPQIRKYDALTTTVSTERVAEFLSPSNHSGEYPYAAVARKTGVADVVTMPIDFATIIPIPGWTPPWPGVPARGFILQDILVEFGVWPQSVPIGVPDGAGALSVSAHPNPFNPRTTVALDLPRAEAASVTLYDLRGAHVRTLQNGRLAAGHHEFIWDGNDGCGRAVAAGVYFCAVRAGEQERVTKLVLVR